MTALDQALIKAFSQQETTPLPRAARPAARTSKNGPSPFEADGGVKTVARHEDNAAAEKPQPTAAAMFDRFDGILAALEKMPNLQAEPAHPDRGRAVENVDPGWGQSPSVVVGPEQWVFGGAEWVEEDKALGPAPKNLVPGPEPQPSIPEPQTSAPEPWLPNLEYRPSGPRPGIPLAGIKTQIPASQIPNPQSPIPNKNFQPRETNPETFGQGPQILDAEREAPSPESRIPSPEPSRFQPAWQVERFSWPRVCRRLISRAGDEWERLADALLSAGAEGRKTLAFAGCRRGEGATTLLLCAAYKLAERGVKTALVDADIGRPRLAKRLGVKPQLGWNDAAKNEEFALDQAVIETANGNLALLAAGESAEDNAAVVADWPQWTACLQQLRNHYDLVLVDLGPLENSVLTGGTPAWATAGAIDALLLVHNRRVTAAEDLNDIQQRLAEAGVNPAGLIENFVA